MAAAPHALTRAPEILSAVTGIDIGSRRDVRVVVEHGALRVEDGRGLVTEFAADQVTAAVWLDAMETRRMFGRRASPLWSFAGAVVFLDGVRPLLTVAVFPLSTSPGPDLDHRQTSGVEAVADALGVTVGPAAHHPELDPRLVRQAPHSPPFWPSPWIGLGAWALVVAVGALGFSAIRHPGDDYSDATVQLRMAGSLLLGAVLLIWLVWGHLRFRRAVSAAPTPTAGAVGYTTRNHATPPAAVAQLQLGRDHVVAWNGCHVKRLAGPAHGGVRGCIAAPDAVAFFDAQKRLLLQFETTQICPDRESRTRLLAACTTVGIKAESTPLDLATGRLPMTWRYYRTVLPELQQVKPVHDVGGRRRGEITDLMLPWACPFSLTLQFLGGLTALDSQVPDGAWLLAASTLEVAIWAAMGISFRLWQRRLIKANT